MSRNKRFISSATEGSTSTSEKRVRDISDALQNQPLSLLSSTSSSETRDNHTTAASLFFGSLQTPSGDGDVDEFLALDIHVRKRTLMRWAAKQKDPDWFSEARSLGLFEAKPWSVYDDLKLLKRGLDAF